METNKEKAEQVYQRLQSMYEIMQQTGGTDDVENAIFEFEDCVSEDDYGAWLEKYSYFVW
ncbi:MAG TPA: hypothetical protein DCZ74_00895 [Treponema sp.]|jgi:hypothetical protein|nr:hypothetical protein [Treponema sp.]